MEGQITISVDPAKLRALIPKAIKKGEEEIGFEDGEAYFDHDKTNVDIFEVSEKEGIGLSIETPFGSTTVWLYPDREFLMQLAPLVVEKLNSVMKAIDALDETK